jgi:hypothetical protein
MLNETTIKVTLLEDEHAIYFQWDHLVLREDVRPAFEQIDRLLDASPDPIYVVVDISSNPQFPLTETVNAAIQGPARHPKLKGWLVVGKSNMARIIGRSINAMTGKRNIQWFESYADALIFVRHSGSSQSLEGRDGSA